MNSVSHLLGTELPLIQGPFGGGLSSVALVAAVSNAGGLGSFGAHHLEPDAIESLAEDLRRATAKPFALNLWVSDRDPAMARVTREAFERRRQDYAALYQRLGIEPPAWPAPASTSLNGQGGTAGSRTISFEDQVEAVLRARPQVFSFVFGIPSAEVLTECRRRGIVTIGAATTIEEAVAVEEAGCDLVLATGFEAGGHRPSFLRAAEDSLNGTLALVPAVRDQVRIPVIAAGGIADARGVRAALALGAEAVQIGTAFLACSESAATPAHRERILADRWAHSTLTRAITGRLARYLENDLVRSLPHDSTSSELLPFPAQSWLTSPIKRAAAKTSDPEHLALYAGQGAPLVRFRSASELVEALRPVFA